MVRSVMLCCSFLMTCCCCCSKQKQKRIHTLTVKNRLVIYLLIVLSYYDITLYRFCGLKGHEMFCEVERSYIEDGFNLYGLRTCVSNFSDCLDLILDRIGPDDSDDSHLTQSACTLYGLIHARFIITAHGLDAMYNKVSDRQQSTSRRN